MHFRQNLWGQRLLQVPSSGLGIHATVIPQEFLTDAHGLECLAMHGIDLEGAYVVGPIAIVPAVSPDGPALYHQNRKENIGVDFESLGGMGNTFPRQRTYAPSISSLVSGAGATEPEHQPERGSPSQGLDGPVRQGPDLVAANGNCQAPHGLD